MALKLIYLKKNAGLLVFLALLGLGLGLALGLGKGGEMEQHRPYGEYQEEYERVKAIKRKHETMLFSIPGVHGVGIGAKEPGKWEAGFVLHVYVSPELGEEARQQIPSELEGVPLVVVETPPPELLDDTNKYRPVPGGCSTAGACLATAGTLGDG